MKENLIDNHWSEFLIRPLNVIDRLYNQMNGESTIDEFHNFIKTELSNLIKSDSSRLNQIPFLNNRRTIYDNLKNRSLVRYRCMIQDMFNPEIYAAILNSNNDKKLNLYTDSVLLDEKYFLNPNKNQIGDRFIYYVISIPGVNEWVKQLWDNEGSIENISNQLNQMDLKTTPNSKRSIDDDAMQNKKTKLIDLNDSEASSSQPSKSDTKKKSNYCLPIKSEDNRSCIVKVYDTKELDFKLNDMIEVIGIIEFPNLDRLNEDQMKTNETKSDHYPEISSMFNNLDLDHEDYVYSELPRIHALTVGQLNSVRSNQFDLINQSNQNMIYSKLKDLFEKIFFGDQLVAQYFICWLISRVYKIQDSLPIGNFPINISNLNKIPKNEHKNFIKKFYQIIQDLCTHSLNLPITIAELNNQILNPFKEKDSSKLQSGLLQLPSNFSLIIDETSLQPGNLKEMGIKNIDVIKEMIAWQSIEYDHLFYTQKINSDINVLVLSEGKSLFDVNCEIKLKPVDLYTNIDEQFNLINFYLNESLKSDLRNYIDYVRTLNCDIPSDLQTKIQDDFVQMRKDSFNKPTDKICADDLHQFLALSRLLAMSEGSTTLSDQHWEKAKSMELTRRKRISN